MDIELPPNEAQFINGLVQSGQYQSPYDAIVDGVRLLMSQQQLKADIQKGIDQLDAGEGIDGDTVFSELREKLPK